MISILGARFSSLHSQPPQSSRHSTEKRSASCRALWRVKLNFSLPISKQQQNSDFLCVWRTFFRSTKSVSWVFPTSKDVFLLSTDARTKAKTRQGENIYRKKKSLEKSSVIDFPIYLCQKIEIIAFRWGNTLEKTVKSDNWKQCQLFHPKSLRDLKS